MVIHLLLKRHGGIAPPIRRRSPSSLTLAEREDISRGIACGSSIRGIAQGLHRCASTISREVARHGGRAQYRANEADQQAWESALRPKPCLLATHTTLREIVASKLMQDWSPEQVSGWLKWQFPKDEGLRVSHETIYRSLFLQARGALKKELIQHLRSKRRIRRSRHSSVHGHSQVDPDKLNRKIVVAWHREYGLSLARFQRLDGLQVLESESRDYEPIVLGKNRNWKIVGKVLWLIRQTL